VGSGRQRGFKFRGALTVDRLIGGDAIVGTNNTPVSGGPNGIEPSGCGLLVPFEALALPTARRAA